MNTPEIEELLRAVERHYGKDLNTTSDFEEFSLHISRTRGIRISASTLKRLWGYVADTHKPRVNTLDMLSSYIGHGSFSAFVAWLKSSTLYNSSYFSTEHLSCADLAPMTELEIGWSPNRVISLLYLGNSEFEVRKSENSKMQPGDRFSCGCFIKGQPLCLPYMIRAGKKTPSFIAGRNGGLTYLKTVTK